MKNIFSIGFAMVGIYFLANVASDIQLGFGLTYIGIAAILAFTKK